MLTRIGEKRTFTHCWWECKIGTIVYGKQYGSSSKKTDYYMAPAILLLGIYISKGIETSISRDIYTHIIHYSQDMEAIYNSAMKKKDTPVICNNVD